VLIFDTFEDSELHAKATRGLDSVERWCIPGMAFHEFLWFFKGRGLQLVRAKVKVEEYLTNEKSAFAACTLDDIQFAVERMKSYHEYNDLIILSVAERMKLPLFSFDDSLKKMAVKNAISVFEMQPSGRDGS
jgi:predicted nucleic acid-binding protein